MDFDNHYRNVVRLLDHDVAGLGSFPARSCDSLTSINLFGGATNQRFGKWGNVCSTMKDSTAPMYGGSHWLGSEVENSQSCSHIGDTSVFQSDSGARSSALRRGSSPKINSRQIMMSKKNNENNNFMTSNHKWEYEKVSWSDCGVCDRIDYLAQPKKDFSKLPNENKNNQPYNGSMHSIHFNRGGDPFSMGFLGRCGGRRSSGPSERICELAKPKMPCGSWCGRGPKENMWECTHPFTAKYCFEGQINPCMVECDGLGHIKVPCFPPATIPKVSKAALNAVATRRLEKLAVPKKVVDSDEYYMWLLHRKPDTDHLLKAVKKLSIHKLEVSGERVLLRCNLDHHTTPPSLETKVERVRLTTQYALGRGAKAVIIASHCGKPSGSRDPSCSLKKASEMLAAALNKEVVYLDDCIGPEAQALCEDPEPGSVFVLENLRYYPEEMGYRVTPQGVEKACTKEEIMAFRAKLFALGDVYVHDDISSLVEMSNTTIGSQKQERAYGWNIFFELSKYNSFVIRPVQPMVAVIGGNFNDKIEVVHNIMGKAQEVLLGGEIASIFLKTLKGVDIGTTSSSAAKEKRVLNAMARAKDIGCVVSLPSDLVVRNTRCPDEYFTVSSKLDVEPWFDIVDIGRTTRSCYLKSLDKAASIVWCGEMGILLDGTSEIGHAIDRATKENCTATFIMDEETDVTFRNLVPDGQVTAVTGDGEVTNMLLHRKMPRGLASLSPYRKNPKKRQVKDEVISFKPADIDKPGYRMNNGFNKLCVDQIDVENKKIMIVCNLTAPVKDGKVVDNYPMRMVVPTIQWVLKRGAKCVVLVSPITDTLTDTELHADSLKPMAAEMEKLLLRKITFLSDTPRLSRKVQKTIDEAHDGSIIMLENILSESEEDYTFMMDNNQGGRRQSPESVAHFCQKLSQMCDVLVNDAFSLLHLDRSSITGCMNKTIPCGFLVKNELKYLSKTFNVPSRKFLVILGNCDDGVQAQMDIFRGLLRDADEIIVTGILGLHMLWVLQGMKLGMSFDRHISKIDIQALLDLAKHHKVRLYFPVDIVTTDDLELASTTASYSTSKGIAPSEYFADIGTKTSALFNRIIKRSKLVLWIGVVGMCTIPEFTQGTRSVYDIIVKCTKDPQIALISIIGGDFLSNFIHSIDPNHEGLSHVTTGAPAMLKMLSEKGAVGLDVISYNHRAKPFCVRRLDMDQIDLRDKRVLLRTDFRNPVARVGTDDQEPLKLLSSTIKAIFKKGATCVVVCGHMGNPKGTKDDTTTVIPIKTSLEKKLLTEITFFEGLTDKFVSTLNTPDSGKTYMLENLRWNPQEIGYDIRDNDERFNATYEEMDIYRSKLSKCADVFINDSMEALHTTDSSVVGISMDECVVGPNLKLELAAFSKLLPKIEKPILAIVGGTEEILNKIKLIYDVIDIADSIIICGRVALNFLKVLENMPLGKDFPDKIAIKLVHRVMKKAAVQNCRIQLPVDFGVFVPKDPTDEESEDSFDYFSVAQGLPDDKRAADVGEKSVEIFLEMIQEASTILYTGTIGMGCNDSNTEAAQEMIEAIKTKTEEGSATSIAFGTHISAMCLSNIDASSGFSHISKGTRTCVDLIAGNPLPGLEALRLPAAKPIPVMDIEQLSLKGRKVFLRLDLDIATVEGVVLNTDKIEDSIPTIKYILGQSPQCVIIAGFRGNPKCYKNSYLSLKPLAMEFEHFLEVDVTFLDEPCSRKSRIICEDPQPGSVFLMENLKFYPAEIKHDEEMPDLLNDDDENTAVSAGRASASEKHLGFQSGGVEHIDKAMWELMPWKTIDQYAREIAECVDVYINDDVTHMWEDLSSNGGFELEERACGFKMRQLLSYSDDMEALLKAPAVAALCPAPKD